MCVVCYQPSGIRMEENRKKGGPFVFYDAVQKNGRLQQKLCAFLILILTLRRLMSYIYIYGAPILDVSRSHTTTQHSR